MSKKQRKQSKSQFVVTGEQVSKDFSRYLWVQRKYGRKAAAGQYPQFSF